MSTVLCSVCVIKMWVFDMADGGGRLLRQRSGHSEPPIKLRFHGNDGQMLLTAGMTT